MLTTILPMIGNALLAVHNYIQEDVIIFIEHSLFVYNSLVSYLIRADIKTQYKQFLQMIMEFYHTKIIFPPTSKTICYKSTFDPNIIPGAFNYINKGGKLPVKMALSYQEIKTYCLPIFDQLQGGYSINICK